MFKKFITALFAASILFGASLANAEMVNINKANAEALAENLNGIGPVKSKAIVDYRRKHGKFKSLDELTNVDGIGEELVKTNKRSMSLTRGATKPSGKPKATSKSSTRKKTSTKKSGSKKTTTKAKKSAPKKASSKKPSSKTKAKKATSANKKKTKSAKSTSKKKKSGKKKKK